MTEQLAGLSAGWAYLSLFTLVFVRVQAVYWIARLAGDGARSRQFGRRLESPRVRRAEELLNRYGPPAVTVSLVTPGVQTAVNALAGISRMPFPRYLIAMVVGCAAWAVVYTVGFLALWAWIATATDSPIQALLLVAGLVMALLLLRIAILRRRPRHENLPSPLQHEQPTGGPNPD